MASMTTTISPPDDLEPLADVSRFLDEHAGNALLLGPDGEQIPLPGPMYETLVAVVDAMRNGQAMSLMPVGTTMTTQEAADFLGISRPTFVRLLEDGRIPFERSGARAHRRVQLEDVLSYREAQHADRRRILSEMVADAEEDGLYDVPGSAYTEVLRDARRGT